MHYPGTLWLIGDSPSPRSVYKTEFSNAGAGDNPLIGCIDHLLDFEISDHPFRVVHRRASMMAEWTGEAIDRRL